MKRSMLFLLVFANTMLALAQVRPGQHDPRLQNSEISYQAVARLNVDSSRIQVDVHYRIGQDFFILVRNEAVTSRVEYVAHGEMLVELLNDQRVSVARQLRQLPIATNVLPRETDQPQSIQGIVSLYAPPGTYTIVFSVDDRESGRTFIERDKKITLTKPSESSFEASEVFFVHSPSPHPPPFFVPVNRGGNVLFGEFGGIACEILRPTTSDTLKTHWTVQGTAEGFGQRKLEFRGTDFRILNGRLALAKEKQGITYSLVSDDERRKTLEIPLPLQHLEPGKYTLDIEFKSGSLTRKQSRQFNVIWPLRPISLTDPDLAIDALRHIATEEDIESMQSGPEAKRAMAFNDFWKSQPHDTSTAYNVAQAEYYYRVDEAIRKFSTARENDGYKTDRGRIYILYGAPQKSERILQPNSSPTEVWTYDHMQKRFVFIDTAKNGNYILSQYESL